MSDDKDLGAELDLELSVDSDGHPIIAFNHSFFASVEGGHFRMSEQTKEPVFVVDLGENNEVSLPFPGIKREFELDADSNDAKMLDLIAEGLNYVKVLRPGDRIPTELLTGEASWEITDAHRTIAYQRLTLQMVTWLSGDEVTITNPEELAQVADDPKTKDKVNEAFGQAAEELGFGRDQKGGARRREDWWY